LDDKETEGNSEKYENGKNIKKHFTEDSNQIDDEVPHFNT
jgi:hypothetical protein